MKNRNPAAVLLLTLITFGLYGIYWLATTKGEMNQRGETIPTTWLIIVPIVNLYWYWKYSEGVEHVTSAKMSKVEAFLLLILIGFIGMPIIQSMFNKLGASDAVPTPAAPDGAVPPQPNETTMVPAQPDIAPTASAEPTPPTAPAPPVDLSGPDVSSPEPGLPPEDSTPPSLSPESENPEQPADDSQSSPPNPPLVQ